MEKSKSWFSLVTPTGWSDVIVRTVKVALVAFVMLHVKEFLDGGGFDTPDIAVDAAVVAAGTLVLNAILTLVKR
jgi:hypothetical protein